MHGGIITHGDGVTGSRLRPAFTICAAALTGVYHNLVRQWADV